MKQIILVTSLFFCSITAPSYAQSATESSHNLGANSQQKRPLTPKDYKLWSSLSGYGEKISNNGQWYAYSLNYNRYTIDTLCVSATKTNTKYLFPSGKSSGQFSGQSKWFGCLVSEKGLGLLELENGTIEWVPKVSKFEFLAVNGRDKYLIAYRRSMSTTAASSLLIINLITGNQETIQGVSEYSIHQASNSLAYINDEIPAIVYLERRRKARTSVLLRTLEDTPITTIITEDIGYSYKKLLWSTNGTALTFLQEAPEGSQNQKRHKLYYYNVKQGLSKLKYLDPITDKSLFQDKDIIDYGLQISPDGKTVFFDVISKENLEMQSKSSLLVNVQVWDTKDKRIYPKLKRDQQGEGAEFDAWRTVWWPLKYKTMLLETKSLPEAIVSKTGTYMLSYNPTAYAPHFKFKGDIDLYLTNLETGERQLFLNQYERESEGFINAEMSDEGKYIHYFKDEHWWIYNLEKQTHTNVTKGLGVQFYHTEDDWAHSGGLQPYGARWTQGDKELLIYDRYDIWLISPKGKAQRITLGKEKQVSYRLVHQRFRKPLNTSEGLLLKTFGTIDKTSGFVIWKPRTGLEALVYKDMRVTALKKAKDRDAYIYREESFDTAPRIMYWEKGMTDAKILLETNPQQKQFQWGKSELIHYTGSEGQPLQGALYYPSNYKVGEKYPMVVDIYEMKSHLLHNYKNPTEYLQDGFNYTNFTADGYLVFLPDIKYKFNDPGISALHCVEAGVKAVLKKGIVEEDHIGLVGHSFGGYETNFIITQSHLFATAVSGASISDLVSKYHSVAFGEFEINRFYSFEYGQYRFTDSFYQNPEAYFINSPLHHAVNINTPLLLWVGEKDATVDWHQSIELYSALRRLGKTCTLLVYPDEKHTIYKKTENMVGHTRRMKAWLDSYLKPEESD